MDECFWIKAPQWCAWQQQQQQQQKKQKQNCIFAAANTSLQQAAKNHCGLQWQVYIFVASRVGGCYQHHLLLNTMLNNWYECGTVFSYFLFNYLRCRWLCNGETSRRSETQCKKVFLLLLLLLLMLWLLVRALAYCVLCNDLCRTPNWSICHGYVRTN